jgi:hypothetical protein
MPNQDSGGTAKWVIGTVLVPILVALIGAGVFTVKDGCLPFTCATGGGDDDGGGQGAGSSGPANVYLSKTSGPSGSTVNVSGEGFASGEQVVITFHTEEMGRTQASDTGRFTNVTVTLPTSFSVFAPAQFDVIATGSTSIKSARASFMLSG